MAHHALMLETSTDPITYRSGKEDNAVACFLTDAMCDQASKAAGSRDGDSHCWHSSGFCEASVGYG